MRGDEDLDALDGALDATALRPSTWLASRRTVTASATSASTAATTSAVDGSPLSNRRMTRLRDSTSIGKASSASKAAVSLTTVAFVVMALARGVGIGWEVFTAASVPRQTALFGSGVGRAERLHSAAYPPQPRLSADVRCSFSREPVTTIRHARRARGRSGQASPRGRAARRSRRSRARRSCRRSPRAPAGTPRPAWPRGSRRPRAAPPRRCSTVNGSAPASASRAASSVSTPAVAADHLLERRRVVDRPVEQERRPAARSPPASGSSRAEISTAPRRPVRPVYSSSRRVSSSIPSSRRWRPFRWRSLRSSNIAGFFETRSSRKRSASSSSAEVLLVGGEPGAEQRDVVVDRLGQVAGVAQLLHRRGAVALGQLAAVRAVQQRQVRVARRRRAQRSEHEQLLGRVREVVLAAHDVGDRRRRGRRRRPRSCRAPSRRAGDHRVVDGSRSANRISPADHVVDDRLARRRGRAGARRPIAPPRRGSRDRSRGAALYALTSSAVAFEWYACPSSSSCSSTSRGGPRALTGRSDPRRSRGSASAARRGSARRSRGSIARGRYLRSAARACRPGLGRAASCTARSGRRRCGAPRSGMEQSERA